MTAKISLDRNRPYGTVHGEDTGGAFFEQDGILFDNDGAALPNQPARNFQTLVAERDRKMKAEEAAKRAYEAVMAGEETGNAPAGAAPVITSEDGPPSATSDSDDTPSDEVDLKAWITGRTRLQFFSVQGALVRQHNFKAHNKAQAVEFLLEKLELQPSDVKV